MPASENLHKLRHDGKSRHVRSIGHVLINEQGTVS
jgi:hypothetical protein